MSIGANIRRIRKFRGMTQRELGEMLGVTQAAIGQYERPSANLTRNTIEKIANALNVSFDALIKDFDGNIIDGNIIREVRIENNLTIQELSGLTGISEKLLNEYEENITTPYERDIDRLAYCFKKDGERLYGEDLPFFCTPTTQPEKPYETVLRDPINFQEQCLLTTYNMLNEVGQREAQKRVQELTEIEKYRKNEENKDTFSTPF